MGAQCSPLLLPSTTQLLPAKPEHAGTYICTAHSALGSVQTRVDINVETAQRHPGAPEVTAPPTVTVLAGDTATLHCTARGTRRVEDGGGTFCCVTLTPQ